MAASRTQLPPLAPMLETGPAAAARVLATRALPLGPTLSTSGTAYRTHSEVRRPTFECPAAILTSRADGQASAPNPGSAQGALSAQQADAGYKLTPGYTYNYQRMKRMSRVESASNASKRDVFDLPTGSEDDGPSSDDNSSASPSCVYRALHADVPIQTRTGQTGRANAAARPTVQDRTAGTRTRAMSGPRRVAMCTTTPPPRSDTTVAHM